MKTLEDNGTSNRLAVLAIFPQPLVGRLSENETAKANEYTWKHYVHILEEAVQELAN